jgi:superfamily II DNA or RNA helicase
VGGERAANAGRYDVGLDRGALPSGGVATMQAADPPRRGTVQVVDDRRTVTLPVRDALAGLARAQARADLSPSMRLLAESALLGLRLVAAGRVRAERGPSGPHWRVDDLDDEAAETVDRLVGEAAAAGLEAEEARTTVGQVLDAVADVLPRAAPTSATGTGEGVGPALRRRLAPARRRTGKGDDSDGAGDLTQLVSLSLRVEADEDELIAGSVRLVLQVHDERDPLHLVDAAVLWTGTPEDHGFGDRARVHATIALRAAAEAWPVLDRLLEQPVPDQLTLDTDELVSLLDDGVEALRGRGVDVLWPRSLGRDLTTTVTLDRRPGAPREGELVEGLLGAGALFAFQWQVALHGEPLSADELRQLTEATGPLLRLRGQWTVVDPSVARRAKKRLVRQVRPVEAVAAALSGVIEVEDVDHDVIVGASLLKVREQLRSAATREPVATPAALRATLRDYQRHGLTWLAELTGLGLGACLADDMGLGKTVTLIALHLHRREAGLTGPTLVVCPASLLGTWEAEIRRFAPTVPVRRFHGSARDLGDLSDGFVLTTYGTLRSSLTSAGPQEGALREVPWDLVVADEAQHVKNPRSATARALRTVPSRARVALTGTPVENDLTELWAILDWATPGLLGSRNAFRKVWAAPIESGLVPSKARQFAELIGPFLLRRRKSDPGIAPELPPKTETDHVLGLTREQVVLYEAFVKDTMERIERADEDQRRGLVLALLTGLKQICNHPAQFLKQASPRLSGRSQKLDAVDELVSTVVAENRAVLVFTQYVAMARLLETHLTRAGIAHQFLHGGTPVREREAMVARFQAGEVPVFLLSLKAGGTGLTLTRADHVIHVDRWWNPAVEEQATDRAYRIGQTKPVQVHRLVTRGTIEERIALLLERKRALADSVLAADVDDSTLGALTELSDAELRDLVTLRAQDDDQWPDEAGP